MSRSEPRVTGLRPPAGRSGFTLVEMMVALVVLSLISLGTLTAMHTLGNTQERLGDTTDRIDELRQVSRFLRTSLQQAIPPPGSSGGPGQALAPPADALLTGRRDELIWLAPLNNAEGLSGLNFMRLFHRDNALRIQFIPFRQEMTAADFAALPSSHVLVEDVSEFRIQYRQVRGGDWLDSIEGFEASRNLPQAFKLTIRARERYWPDLLIAPSRGGPQ